MNFRDDYVEIDLPYCSLNFGESPCTATGTHCFNTRNNSIDCGDPANYTETTLTVRFAYNNGRTYWPFDDVNTFRILSSVDSSGAMLDPAESMGSRATCIVNLDNSKSTMSWIDKNFTARGLIASDAAESGTFLGKFKAINPFIFGANVRVYRGRGAGQYDVEHYTVDNFSGPNNSNGMVIKLVDALKLTNGDSANWPPPSSGVLIADMDETTLTFSVEAGQGDEYPTTVEVAIGNEGMLCTRSGDTFTAAARGLYGQVEDHKAGDVVQVIGRFSGDRASDIIYTLIDQGTPLDASELIDLDTWTNEVNNFQPALYSAVIVRPESVSKLINELIQQAGLIVWFDVRANKIQLKVLRPVSSSKSFDMGDIAGGLSQSDNQKDRVSQVWTYYNQKNPFKKLDDFTNYYSRLVSSTNENLYLTEKVRKVYSRWIPIGGQPNALDLNARLISRYQNPPRDFRFSLKTKNLVSSGDSIVITHRSIEDALGNQLPTTCYVTNSRPDGFMTKYMAKEFDFTDFDTPTGPTDLVIPIEQDFSTTVNLRELYATVRSSLTGVTSVTFDLLSGSVIGSDANSRYALEVGDFEGVPVSLIIRSGGFIVGKAGEGAVILNNPIINGGPAINADYPITIDNQGVIGGGGGAGGVGGFEGFFGAPFQGSGTAGAGFNLGLSRFDQFNGPVIARQGFVERGVTAEEFSQYVSTVLDATIALSCGDGGDLGQNGTAGFIVGGSSTAGGTAGAAVTNNSNITWINQGDIRGSIS